MDGWLKIRWFNFLEDLDSLKNYFRLSRNGFSITRSDELGGIRIYRFWWDDKILPDFPDINETQEKTRYTQMMNGKVTVLERRFKKRYEYRDWSSLNNKKSRKRIS